jgi:hypothetical protein
MVVHILIFVADKKTEGTGLNGSKLYHHSISSSFLAESNFNLLLSFQNFGTVSHFQMICLLFSCPNFDLYSSDETASCI